MIDLGTRLVLDSAARFRRFEDEGIVINQRTAEAVVVSEVGTRLIELADGTRTLEECAAALGDEFDAEPQIIAEDVLRFARELVDAGIASVA